MKPVSFTKPVIDVRVIRPGSVNLFTQYAVDCLGTQLELEDPFIYVHKINPPGLSLSGTTPLSELVNVDKIPPEFDIIRRDSRNNSGPIFRDEGTVGVRVYSPREKMYRIQEFLFESVTEVMKKYYGVQVQNAPWRPGSNDMVFMKDGKYKKFLGVKYHRSNSVFSFSFLLHFNHEKVDGIYKLDNPKFLVKGDVKHITDVVGGLDEVVPLIDATMVDKVLTRLAQKLRWQLNNDIFTEQESKHVEETALSLQKEDTREWVLTGKL